MRRFFAVLLLISGTYFALTACEWISKREALATVLSSQGTVSVQRNGDSSPIAVTRNTLFGAGDIIQTTEDASLHISFLPGILGKLGNQSKLQLLEVTVAKDGNAMTNAMRTKKVHVQLLRGVFDGVVMNMGAAEGGLRIDTPFGVVTAPAESLCRIEVSDTRARIVCVRGRLQCEVAGRGANFIEAGFFEDWPASIHRPIAVDSDPEGQSNVLAALESEQELRSLQMRARLEPFPWRRAIPEKP